jgi:hypothetical protein
LIDAFVVLAHGVARSRAEKVGRVRRLLGCMGAAS